MRAALLELSLFAAFAVVPFALAQDAGAPERDPSCRQECLADGRCTFVSGQCVAGTSDDCAAVCAREARCTAQDWQCVRVSSDDCRRSSACARYGLCTLVDGQCVRASSEDCRLTTLCRDNGFCTFRDGNCVADGDDCHASSDCSRLGRCTARDGRCELAGSADCARTEMCRTLGRCAATRYEGRMECAATTAAMCRRSEACVRYGHCGARDGRCVATSEVACRRSRGCREEGTCSLLTNDGVSYCGPADDGRCARATRCLGGRCSRSQSLYTHPHVYAYRRAAMGWWCTAERAGSTPVPLAGAIRPAIAGLFERRPTRGARSAMGVLGTLGGTSWGGTGVGTIGTIGGLRGGTIMGTGSGGLGLRGGGGGLGGVATTQSPTWRIGVVESAGGLSREVVRRVTYRYGSQITACESQSRPRASRRVTVRFEIDPSGRAVRPVISGGVPAGLRRCLSRMVAGWSFPTATAPSRVTLPLFLSPPRPPAP